MHEETGNARVDVSIIAEAK